MKNLSIILFIFTFFISCSQKNEFTLGRGSEVVFRQSDMEKIKYLDLKKSEDLCKNGNKDECYLSATSYLMSDEVKKNFQKAGFYFDLGCSLNDERCCNNLAGMYELGLGTPKNLNKALYYYSLACKLGHKIACLNQEVTQGYLSDINNAKLNNKKANFH